MKAWPPRRIAVALGWTLALGVAVLALDRLAIGPRPPKGWVEVHAVADIPSSAGPVLLPSFLPEALMWPPATILYRDDDDPGYWLGLEPRRPDGPHLWIGNGTDPTPAAVGEAASCLPSGEEVACPAGWHHLSRRMDGGRVIHVLGTLEAHTVARILDGLSEEVGRR